MKKENDFFTKFEKALNKLMLKTVFDSAKDNKKRGKINIKKEVSKGC